MLHYREKFCTKPAQQHNFLIHVRGSSCYIAQTVCVYYMRSLLCSAEWSQAPSFSRPGSCSATAYDSRSCASPVFL